MRHTRTSAEPRAGWNLRPENIHQLWFHQAINCHQLQLGSSMGSKMGSRWARLLMGFMGFIASLYALLVRQWDRGDRSLGPSHRWLWLGPWDRTHA